MNQDEKAYRDLQKHLDNQAVGFPATSSGAEIKVLKHIFSPFEARIATCLRFKPEPLEIIYKRAQNQVATPAELSDILDGIEKKGGLETRLKHGKKWYCTAPLVVGMYEYQLGRLTPEFIKDFNEYTADLKFGIDFLSTKLPQMRTIPVAKSISIQNNVSTFDEATALLEKSNGIFAVCECICRKKKELQGGFCQVTDQKETCLAIGDIALAAIRNGLGRVIDLDEAVTVLEKNQKAGLVLQPSNTQTADFICSCCGCCCGMLGMHKNLPKPLDFWVSNFYAEIDTSTCNGCGICEKRCQVGAAKLAEKTKLAAIDRNLCIGCGLCVTACPQTAVILKKKMEEILPPPTREDLYDIIMSNKMGKFGKLKLTGKLILDAVKTGQLHLLKPE